MVQAKPKSRKKPKPPGLRPLGDRVIIEREEALTETPGGIAVPDTAAEASLRLITGGQPMLKGQVIFHCS